LFDNIFIHLYLNKKNYMQHKKFTLSVVLLFGLGLTGLHAQTLYVKENSGTQTAYPLNNIKKMSFPSGNLIVSNTGSSGTYPLSSVRYVNFVDLSTGIPSAEKPNGTMRLYPNPVDEIYTVELATAGSKNGIIAILSLDGKVLHTQTLKLKTNIEQVNVSNLPQGFYLCRVNTGKTIETTKFFKR